MPGLYRVRFEKMIDLTIDEFNAIFDYSEPVEDSSEYWLALDFQDNDPDMIKAVQNLKSRVRPEVFKILKMIADEGSSFVLE